MKSKWPVVLLAGILFSGTVIAQQKLPSAESLLKKAYKTAAVKKKNVFIIFHASWCGPCKTMQASMNDKKVKAFFDSSYIIVDLVAYEFNEEENNPGAGQLLEKHNDNNASVPFWMIQDATGKVLGDSRIIPANSKDGTRENMGCPGTEKEIDYFISLLKRTSGLTNLQLEAIRKRFRANGQ
ncbi:MAG: thioredoxin family protein [Chitinophagales bacterium]|nr:thioredoxin family protein [Chitinophagales bacterium]